MQRFVARRYDLLRVTVVAIAVLVLFVAGITLWSLIVVSALTLLALWGLNAARGRETGGSDGPGPMDGPTPDPGQGTQKTQGDVLIAP